MNGRESTLDAPAEPHREGGEAGGSTGPSPDRIARRQIRGSGLLLAGRGISNVLRFVAELLVVRYLATAEYGSWTYALSAVVLLRGICMLGLNRAVARFAAIHLERGERDEFFGVLALVFGGITVMGTIIVAVFYAFPDAVAGLVGARPGQSLEILYIMVFLAPVGAVELFLTGLCAVFSNSRAIFVRRYVLNPLLRLGVAVILVLAQAEVALLAYGWLAAAALGVLYYAGSVYQELRNRGLLRGGIRMDLRLPVRRVFGYTLPMMGTDLCTLLITATAAPLLLGYFSDMNEVALYRVAIPLVALNKLVRETFGMLYEPAAARLVARDDYEGVERLYWRSAGWVTALTFPGFALSFGAAVPLTILLFGERYAAAAPILSFLSIGMFADAVLGFNGATLRVTGNVRWLVGATVTGAFLTLGLNVALIPPLGALGAAIATGIAWLAFALLKQIGLRLSTGITVLGSPLTRLYAITAAATGALLVFRVAVPGGLWSLAPAGLAAVAVPLMVRSSLSIADTFPELARLPLLRRLVPGAHEHQPAAGGA